MYENQAATQAGSLAGYANAIKPARDVPVIQRQIEMLEKALAGCHMVAERLEQAADRVTGPRPAEVRPENAGRTPPHSLEHRLGALHENAQYLTQRLNDTCSRFDAAI
jgi:hypothetical protein